MDHYYEGKKNFLDGKHLPDSADLHARGYGEVQACDFRSGHRVAASNKKHHPDWTDSYILKS
jgi:hypothetical protein